MSSNNAIPTTISTIYVPQSSREAYKTATNWKSFADKIESNNIYLSLIRFNKKNKEYINEKINDNNITIKNYVDEKSVKIEQTIGDSETAVMSQKAVTNELSKKLISKNVYIVLDQTGTNYADFDTFPANEIVTCNAIRVGSSAVPNSPINKIFTGTVITISNYLDKIWLTAQIAFTDANDVFVRYRYNNSYNQWTPLNALADGAVTSAKIADGAVTSAKIAYGASFKFVTQVHNAITSPYNDFDTIPRNTVVTYNSITVNEIVNAPINLGFSGSVYTHSGYDVNNQSNKWLTSQLAILKVNNKTRVFSRYRFTDTYTNWVELSSVDFVETTINEAIGSIASPNTVVSSVDLYSPTMFEKIAVVGDSFGAGLIIDSSVSPVVQKINPYLRWGAQMCRMLGNTYVNYSKSGANFQTCITDTLPSILNEEACNLYIINLGINGDSYDVGTIDDVSTTNPEDNPNTLYGNCGKIVLSIQQHAPKAKIILAYQVVYDNATKLQMLQEVAEKLGCAFINPQTDDYFFKGGVNSPLRKQFYTNHPTAVGYSGMAFAFIRLISKCMSENVDYFKFYDLY